MSWSAEARVRGARRATRRVEVICQYCGAPYETSWNMRSLTKACPKCKPAVTARRDNERRQARRKKGERYVEQDHFFRVVEDPGGGWTDKTRLSGLDVKLLLRLRYLEEGTVLEDTRDGKMLVVASGELKTLTQRAQRCKGAKEE